MATFRAWTGTESRALRDAFRMGQKPFAAKLGVGLSTVKHWEAGRAIRGDMQAALDTLLSSAPPEVARAFRSRLHPETEENDVDRRQLLKAGSVLGVGTLATLGLADTDRLEWLASGVGRPDPASVNVVRTTLYSAMQLDDMLGSPAAQGLVIAQQQLVEGMLRDCSSELRPSILSLYAEWTGFAGCLAWDARQVETASRLYHLAYESAHEAEDADLGAYMLCHLSQLAISEKRPRVAVDYAVAARSWTGQSSDRHLRAYVAVRMAEAAALAGQRAACLDALAEADRYIAGIQPCHPSESRAYFVGAGIMESYRGNCLTILGEAAPAARATRDALELMGSTFTRDRAVTLLELERSLIRLGDVDEAAGAVGDAAVLAAQNRSPRLAEAIVGSRRELSPWADTSAVRQLDELLVDRDIVTV